jgi:hypothetical protein
MFSLAYGTVVLFLLYFSRRGERWIRLEDEYVTWTRLVSETMRIPGRDYSFVYIGIGSFRVQTTGISRLGFDSPNHYKLKFEMNFFPFIYQYTIHPFLFAGVDNFRSGHLQRATQTDAAWIENASEPCSSGTTHSDRAVHGDANAVQICGRFASARTLCGHAK